VAKWYIFTRFGILCREKSGNPAPSQDFHFLLALSLDGFCSGNDQGDQIGRIFALLGDNLLWPFFENYKRWPNFLLRFSTGIWTKMGWASLWAIFSLTHLVTMEMICR
jgi:hypothetical protein